MKSKPDEMQIRRDLAEKRLALAVKKTSWRQAEIDRFQAKMAEKKADLERTENHFNTEMCEMVEFNRNMQEKFKDIKQSALVGKIMASPCGSGSLRGGGQQMQNTSLPGMFFQTAVNRPRGFFPPLFRRTRHHWAVLPLVVLKVPLRWLAATSPNYTNRWSTCGRR